MIGGVRSWRRQTKDGERPTLTEPESRQRVVDEYVRVRLEFRTIAEGMSREDLDRSTKGTRWSNQQMLFHLVLGYLVVRTLLPLCRIMSHLPPGASIAFAALLDNLVGPFDQVNYLGAVLGARLLTPQRLVTVLDRVTLKLGERLQQETTARLERGMFFPQKWDPFFKRFMTTFDIYRYPTMHFDFHRQQLTI